MYLLDNPDHYTSHKFRPFHWSSYVTEAQKAWNTEQKEDNKVVLIKKNGRIFGLSQVYDYIYRPSELESMSLYDWIRRCERVKICKNNKNPKAKKNSEILINNEAEDHESEFDYDYEGEIEMNADENNLELEPDTALAYKNISTDASLPAPAHDKSLSKNLFPFIYGHPLADSHAIALSTEEKGLVPNFIGPGLPRRDKGDYEYYCMTMLVFFKPWRSGIDLKEADESWNTSFINYRFTQRNCDVMNTFQLRYECLDSRDDFRA
ncbi:hypothetical protein K435DRAFT_700485, partial [Dendrothele bispora CBS 962.96]